jgi:glutamate carboxypeptidase
MQYSLFRHCAVTLGLLVLAGGAAAQSRPEPATLAAAEAERTPFMATLRELVEIESGSADAAGLARIADYTEARLKSLGAATERRVSKRGPGSIVTGTFTGTGTRTLMLMAHMDTVYPPGILTSQPFRVADGRAYGPGIADDKGGVAAILHVLAMLRQAGWHDYARLTVLFNPDEEAGSHGSKELIAALAAEHDFVFSCEPTLGQGEGLLLGASGFARVSMTVEGRASHAGVAPDKGRNALIELAHQLQQTDAVSRSVPGARLNWTLAQAGVVGNQIPDRATATGDLRYTRADAVDSLEGALRQAVRQGHVPDTRTLIAVERGRPPFVATPAARDFARKAQAIYAELGRDLALQDGTGGGTDAAYANLSGRAIVLESLGLVGAGIHSSGEYIELDAIVPRLYLLTRLLREAAKP